jgi:serine/threonine protein phosphatase PrpC
MEFGYVYEAGKRARNEDALIFRSSLFAAGELVFAAVCDGMGGMEDGQDASYFCVNEMEAWYDRQLLPLIGTCGLPSGEKELKAAIQSKGFGLYRQINRQLFEQMRYRGRKMGTTATMCIIYRKRYYLFHLGDSRAYLLGKFPGKFSCRQLTKDQGTERGLCKCLGLNKEWKPDFRTGALEKKGLLLCTDGFWRKYEPGVWKTCLNPVKMRDEAGMRKRLRELADYNLRMGETDNISALYVSTGRTTSGRILRKEG